MNWNFDISAAPRDGRAVLGLFEDLMVSMDITYYRFEVMEWDVLEGECWLNSNGFDEVDGHPIAWCEIPSVPDCHGVPKSVEEPA